MAQMGREGKRVFLLGAKPGVADAAGEKLRERFPGLVIAGTNDGYFQDDDPVVEDQCRAAGSAARMPRRTEAGAVDAAQRPRLRVGLMAGLGGLDVFAGNVKRAPSFPELGLEWFYRLIKGRSASRPHDGVPKFLFAAIGHQAAGKKHHGEG